MKISYEVLNEIAYAVEGEVRTNYSGRGMFGDTCVGIVLDVTMVELGVAIADCVTDKELRSYLRNSTRTDSMGHSTIAYWSGLTCDNAPEEE